MNEKKETGLASLTEICEEKKVIQEEDWEKPAEKSVYFSSMEALIQGALSLVDFFEHIHKDGYVYGGNAVDVFRFSLKTGEFMEDAGKYLVKAYSSLPYGALEEAEAFGTGTIGASKEDAKPRHRRLELNELLAPELVEAAASGQEFQFTMETDWYFMSVVLFEYFFHTGSPFEGRMMVNRCFLSPMEKEMYRIESGRFCMDIGDIKNPPVKGIQDKLIKYWSQYPKMLHRMFRRAFMDGGKLPDLRPTEVDWKQLLVRMAMDYQSCRCGFKGFSHYLKKKENGTFSCPKCGKTYYPLTNGMDRILLKEGGKLYACQTGRDPFDKDTVTGLIVENKHKKGLYGIKNISRGIWRGMYPDNTTREIGSGQGIPIWNGMKLRFERGEDWSLKLVLPLELDGERTGALS